MHIMAVTNDNEVFAWGKTDSGKFSLITYGINGYFEMLNLNVYVVWVKFCSRSITN